MPNASDGYGGADWNRLRARFRKKFSNWSVGGWREREDLVQKALQGAWLAYPKYRDGAKSLETFLFERGCWFALTPPREERVDGLNEETRRVKGNLQHAVSLSDPAYEEGEDGEDGTLRIEVLDGGTRTAEEEFCRQEEEERVLEVLEARLSPRERTVCLLLADGYSVAEIARELGISQDTVRTYTKRAREKLSLFYERK